MGFEDVGGAVGSQDYSRIREIKDRFEDMILIKANVVGVGIGLREQAGERLDEVCLVVMVTHKVPRVELAPEDLIPTEIEGVGVDVQTVGELKAQT
jgi:hypothetical protein